MIFSNNGANIFPYSWTSVTYLRIACEKETKGKFLALTILPTNHKISLICNDLNYFLQKILNAKVSGSRKKLPKLNPSSLETSQSILMVTQHCQTSKQKIIGRKQKLVKDRAMGVRPPQQVLK